MAESPEHQYLSQTFLDVLNRFSHSKLYAYRESERGRFDIACMLTETWQYLLNGQTLWKHSEGIDKDLRSLLVASDAPLVTYVARDTTRHRSVFFEAANDYRKVRESQKYKHFKVFWVPADFDADSEESRRLIEFQLRHEVAEDILLNVLFGRLNPSRIHAALIMGPGVELAALELAVLHSIAFNGFTSLNHMSGQLRVSPSAIRERISRLQMSGLILQERRPGQPYYAGSAGRAFLRLCAQVYKLVEHGQPLSSESIEILKMLGIEPCEVSNTDYIPDFECNDYFDPKSVFMFLAGKTVWAKMRWSLDWSRSDYKCAPDEQDSNRWLAL